MDRLLRAYAAMVERHARWVLLGLAIVTVLLGAQLPRLSVRNDLQTFFPDDPVTRRYGQIARTFGADSFPRTLYVRFTPRAGATPTSPSAIVEMEAVLQALRAVPGVRSAEGLPDLVKLIESGLHGGLHGGGGADLDLASVPLPVDGDDLGYSFADIIRLTTQRLSTVQNYLSVQGSALALARLDPEADVLEVAARAAEALAPLQASSRALEIELMSYGSSIRVFNAATAQDIRTLVPWAAIAMAVILAWAFRARRSVWWVLLALVGVVTALAWGPTLPPAGRALLYALVTGLCLWRLWAERQHSRAPHAYTAIALAVLALLALSGPLAGIGLGLRLKLKVEVWFWVSSLALAALGLALVAKSFRRLNDLYLPLAVVGLAGLWTFGLMSLTGVSLSFLMVAVLPLLLGVGLDDALHLLHRYEQERERGHRNHVAMQRALRFTGRALVLTTLTTVMGFAALLGAASPPVRAFGLLAAFTMICAFLATVTLIPAVKALLGEPPLAASSSRTRLFRMTQRATRFLTRPHVAAVWVALAIAVGLAAFAAGRTLKVYPFDLRWMLPADNDQVRLYERINEEYRSYDQIQVLLEGDLARLEVVRTLTQVLGPALAASPYTRRVRHFGNLLDDARHSDPQLEAAFMGKFAEGRADEAYCFLLDHVFAQPTTAEQARTLIRRTATADGHYDYDYDYDQAVVRVDVLRAHDPEGVAAITQDVERRLAPARQTLEALGLKVSLTGSPYLEALSLVALRDGFFRSMAWAFLLVGAVLVLAFRSLVWGLVSLVPMALVMALELATIHLLGLRISASTALVAATGIGLGVDYTIHLAQRAREHGRLDEASAATARALLAASGTTLAAFLTLMLGQIPWNRDFGLLAGTAMAYALIAALGVYPALLALLRPWLRLPDGEGIDR